MKYGSELSQRSVPEWKSHNLDYDEIKHIIKRATTDDAKDKTTEQDVLEALKVEFENISLFVRSKTGEIDRRIVHCQKTIDHIAEDDRLKEEAYATQGKSYAHHLNSKRRQTRLYKLRTEINRVTVEVQNLARFIGVQRTGFRKLLKKYAKWSGKQTLHQSFSPILDNMYSFTQQDFTPVFLELSFIFETLRQAKYQSINTYIQSCLGGGYGDGNPAQFDTEAVTLATSMPNAGAITMWVHPDHITELKVMLLKTMSFVDSPKTLRQKGEVLATSADALSPGTPTLSRRPSLTLARVLSDQHVTEHSHAVYLDDPRKLISIQTSTEPGQIRWVDVLPRDTASEDDDSPHNRSMHMSDANPETDPDYVLCAPVGGFRHFAASHVSRDLADAIYHSSLEESKWEIENLNGSGKLAVEWVAKRNAVPLSQASMHRSRFLFEDSLSMSLGERRKSVSIFEQGTPSGSNENPNESSKVWATLDETITIKRAGFHSHYNKEGPKSASFPYAVLEIKWRGLKPSWVGDIEKSHLVHVVEGFSVYSHSIALFHSQALSKPPHWLKMLNKVDLLKLPPKKVREEPVVDRAAPQVQLSRDQTPQPASGSILLNSSPASLPSLTDEFSDTSQETTEPPKVRYWNEFDNPEDEDDGGIFIYANTDEPNFKHDFLSEGHVNKLIRISDNLAEKVQQTATKVRRLIGIKPKSSVASDEESASDNEEESLLRGRLYSPRLNPNYQGYDYGSAASSVSEQVTDIYGEDEFAGYGHQQQLVADRRDRVLSLFYSTCFLLSTLIVGVLCGIIAGEDMNQVSGGAIALSFLAFMFSTALGIVGLTLYLMRTSTPSMWHQTFVFVVMMLNVCFGVGGFSWLLAELV